MYPPLYYCQQGGCLDADALSRGVARLSVKWNNANETAELLLTQGAEINAKTDKGRTPLSYEAEMDAAATAELLLARGAEVNTKADKGPTPLHYAAWKDAYKTTQLLLT